MGSLDNLSLYELTEYHRRLRCMREQFYSDTKLRSEFTELQLITVSIKIRRLKWM